MARKATEEAKLKADVYQGITGFIAKYKRLPTNADLAAELHKSCRDVQPYLKQWHEDQAKIPVYRLPEETRDALQDAFTSIVGAVEQEIGKQVRACEEAIAFERQKCQESIEKETEAAFMNQDKAIAENNRLRELLKSFGANDKKRGAKPKKQNFAACNDVADIGLQNAGEACKKDSDTKKLKAVIKTAE
jgi:hypothetical protein